MWASEQPSRVKPEEEDKQLTQNGAILVKFILVLWFMIFINYTLDWLQTFKFVQFCPSRTPISAPNFSVFFILVLDLYNLTLNWLLNF